ncbi:cyclic nucleotide-binding/CBS domain-containing protein [Vibrio sp. SM6]|uniref:Cyclic nucleotide-binding/CBS domain-containing protein n=1 Tax=Vibrio agarilyticus TaxID=2726741 RepID=A0A7X8YI33_9VIBR|nr:DUF294 nucleotidyltransferase-like domain-containing protein [Vibrio agarilyticus]NLS13987.1 cyclic nucleotide-binding/CBS domain-containing protein [Vibrio agarilyticus]
MPHSLNMAIAPFNLLTPREQQQINRALDVAYYRSDERLFALDSASCLHVVIKGTVEERHASTGEILAHYTHDDLFDVRAQWHSTPRHHYIALEDTLCYLVPSDLFRQLYQNNAAFADYFASDLATRNALIDTAKQQQNLAEFILTKVDASIYHPALILSPTLSIQAVTQRLKAARVDAALIELTHDAHQAPTPANYGIVTRTNMLHALMLDSHDANTPIGEIATAPVCFVEEGTFLFHAMVMMTRQRMKRVMVCKNGAAVGMLDMTQILSTFSTHSHVLSLAIHRATTIDELVQASAKQRQLVASLVNNGIRTRFMMALTAAINELIMEKAFQLIVPQDRQTQCCLVVLGSEGRGEQVLKTDQDNALIIENGIDWPECAQVMQQLTDTLLQLGYPRCPGNVMVSNPDWVRSQQQWQQTLTLWIERAQATHVMNLSIFADAHAVAGNRDLLTPVRETLTTQLKQRMLALQEMVRPAIHFALPLTLFGYVKNDQHGVDLKTAGIFPIVHGVRALAFECAITQTNTFERLSALQQIGLLEKESADNLSEALKLFIRMRLNQQLLAISDSDQTEPPQNRATGSQNHVDLHQLDRTQRDLLRHSLHVVKKFKAFLAHHYHIRD